MIEKAFYINLDSRPDRKEFMEEQLTHLSINFERCPAVQPNLNNLVKPDGIYNSYFKRAIEKLRKRAEETRLHKRLIGEFGCYLTHLRIHQIALERELENYLILEDDCKIPDDIIHQIEIALKSIDNRSWDLLRSCWKSNNKPERFTLPHKFSKHSHNNPKSHMHFGGSHFTFCRGGKISTLKIIEYMNEEFIFPIDGVYSTNQLDVYHAKLKVEIEDLGTDIPKAK